MSKKIYRKWNFYLYLPQKNKAKEDEQKYHPSSKLSFLKLLKKLSLVALVTNDPKLLLLSLAAKPWWKFEKQKSV